MQLARVLSIVSILLPLISRIASAGDGNRLTYLDDPVNPYYVGRNPGAPGLTTPQWVGEDGVEAVVVLAIDDMRGHEKWEVYLRPILERLKQIDGRAPVSIMTCTIDLERDGAHLQQWLKEGLSLEVHTIDHPCPLLKDSDFAKAKSTVDRCIDLLNSVPGNRPVAFRMPCCDSLNTLSPRFFAEIFNKTTERGNFLQIDTSVFNVFTSNDRSLPRELVIDPDGRDKFLKYIPADRTFVNTIEDYPYPYVIGGLCWEFPCVTPSDWSAQHRQMPNNPVTVEDWKAALDATVIKQGTFNLVFHPHGWIEPEQIVELIDHAVAKHGKKVKFLTFREASDRLNKLVSRGPGLRTVTNQGDDNGVRWLDLNNDGFMDMLFGNGRNSYGLLWTPATRTWNRAIDAGSPVLKYGHFGILQRNGNASLVDQGMPGSQNPGVVVHHFTGTEWVYDKAMSAIPPVGGQPVLPFSAAIGGSKPQDRGVRLRDVDGDGICELIVSNGFERGQQAIFRWNSDAGRWQPVPFTLPAGTSIVDAEGREAGLRFVDLDEDGHDDVIFSNGDRYSIHLFDSTETGWSREVIVGKRGERPAEQEIPPIVRTDGTNNGFWVHSRQLWWQNEDTAKLKDLVDRRPFSDLLTRVTPAAKSAVASLRSIRARPGFEVELVAAEPLVEDPIALAWGPDGKLWVVEMGDYPLGTDGKGKHGGRVRFLEDTDGDGRYDKSTVFLDGIGFPTGVMPWRKGVLVTAAPDIFYAEDTDGDGKADVRRVLFTGFNQGNQQHRLNGLVWGLDNWIYCANGDSGGGIKVVDRLVSSVPSPPTPLPADGARGVQTISINGRDFRIRPDEGLIDPQTGQSQFGRTRDDWGNWFGCNNSNPMYQFVLADHYTRRNSHVAPPDPRVNVSVTPGAAPVYPISRTLERFNDPNTANRFTSACSVIVYRDDLFGPVFDGNSFVSEPVHNLVHREIMSQKGTGVVSQDGPEGAAQNRLPSPFSAVTFSSQRAADEATSEFVASSDNWFRPTTIKTGPDGSLWIADMYRQVIEHPEWIPKEWQQRLDLRAGHDKGRIYRVFPVGARPRPIPRLDRLDTAGLVAALDSPSGWQRDMAQMMLVWRQDRAAAPLLEKIAATSERPLARLHALCSLDGLDALRDETLLRGLADAHPGVRRHAIRLSERRVAKSPALGDALVKLVADADPQVRLQLAYTLGEWSDARAGRALGEIAVRDAADPYIVAAVMSSATNHVGAILAVLLEAVSRGAASPPVSNTPNAVTSAQLTERLLALAAAMGDERSLGRVLQIVASPRGGRFTASQFSALGDVLETLQRRGRSLGDVAKLGDSPETLAENLTALFAAARAVSTATDAAIADRVAAVRLVGREPQRLDDDVVVLAKLLTPQTPGEVQEAAVARISQLRPEQSAELLLGGWKAHGPKLRSAIVALLLTRDATVAALLDRIQSGDVLSAELDAAHRQRLLEHTSTSVRDRAGKLFGRATASSRETVLDEYRASLSKTGDAQRGAAVFQESCSACHRLAGVGTEVGADLSALANRSPDVFLTAILDPNRAVEARYLNYIAATKDGRVLTGMIAAETGNSIALVGQDGKRETILRADVEELKSTGKSLMPEGLEKDVSVAAMSDLLAFLGSHGPPRKTFDRNKPELVRPDPLRGEIYLTAANAEIYGDSLVFEDKYANLGYWSSPNDHAVWTLEADRAGRYVVTLDWACDDNSSGNTLVLETGDYRLVVKVPGTDTWDKYRKLRVGEVTLVAGRQQLVARPAGPITGAMIDLRGIQLTPAAKLK